jgi:hypothetical protein
MISCTVPVQPEASSLMTSTARLTGGRRSARQSAS